MTRDQIAQANAELRSQSPQEIVRWALAQSQGRAIAFISERDAEADEWDAVCGVAGARDAPGLRTRPAPARG